MSTTRSTLLSSKPKLFLGQFCIELITRLTVSLRIRSVLLYNKMGLLLDVFEKEYKAMMG